MQSCCIVQIKWLQYCIVSFLLPCVSSGGHGFLHYYRIGSHKNKNEQLGIKAS